MAKQFDFTRMDLMREIAAITGGRCLLGFSGGKDAIATWLTLRESGLFPEIVPYHMALVPGLKFVEDTIAYFEDAFNTPIIRIPHISFYKQMGSMMFQPPERREIIERHGFDQLTRLTYLQVQEEIAYDLGWDIKTTWTATGIKMADSISRRINITKFRARAKGLRKFYPVFDMTDAEVLAMPEKHGMRLPVDYEIFKTAGHGMSFDGLDIRFVKPIKERFPEDFERIRFWYPLVDVELLRYETYGKDYIKEKLKG